MNIEINGVTLQGDFMDAGFMEILEPALVEVKEDIQKTKTQPRGLVAAGYDALNKAMDKFFNKVFGPETSKQLFGESRNVMIRMEALNGFNSMQGHKPKQKRT